MPVVVVGTKLAFERLFWFNFMLFLRDFLEINDLFDPSTGDGVRVGYGIVFVATTYGQNDLFSVTSDQKTDVFAEPELAEA